MPDAQNHNGIILDVGYKSECCALGFMSLLIFPIREHNAVITHPREDMSRVIFRNGLKDFHYGITCPERGPQIRHMAKYP
uniref:Uncharacterized protein n=1 Tax=Candidatus Kentrum eta TaxID=2126337 RepID=A0A450UF80_9GAMM|nr:MAG: hypothetical protein BECKH772A_GA0070896_1001411 [Candidatus Kentron sp. H]VFJ91112.1 MAG: hypothetical protein BECKH772B_GA0070898_1001411 [Candidatus Kentron sp. H]VFJ97427.1 MAG: hypothetical protein BECKH772C_GA0070978_1001311 [Candidatus Kentron sp. H]